MSAVESTAVVKVSDIPANESTKSPSTDYEKFKVLLEKFLDSSTFVTFMMILTFWALFSNDLRVSLAPKEADDAFAAIIAFAFFLFVFEIVATSVVKPEYLAWPVWEAQPLETTTETWTRRLMAGSFYFWLDWLSTLTCLFEIPWALGDSVSGGSGAQSAKAVRLVRLVRMVRLVRLVKLYKYAQQAKELKKKQDADKAKVAAGGTIDDNDEIVIEESHVGAAMADLTNKRVLILILVMLIVVPLLSVSESDTAGQVASEIIHSMAIDPNVSQSGFARMIEFTKSQLDVVVIQVVDSVGGYHNVSYVDNAALKALRSDVATEFVLTSSVGVTTTTKFSAAAEAVESANFSIMTTVFVMFLLLMGTYAFSNDVETLVIEPIEKMCALVKKISADPLGVDYDKISMEGFAAGMETTVLLSTIAKIGGLMSIGFGSAGAAVIARNLRGTGKLNLMGAGNKITSIFGFCDVRNFTDTTECLQEEVMLFVNRIAHILHSIIVQCEGSANKNIGDAFLLTWKLEEHYSAAEKSKLADQALLAFCKSHIELCKYQEFICNFTVAATQRLFKRFPTYRVKLGTGLHVGWAIEGAIGSDRKIDATYLSPHVNMSEYLESSTKAYGVSLLVSEPFFKLLSPAAQKYCRQVDRIKRNVREEPLGLYCYDIDLDVDFNELIGKKKKAPAINPGVRRGSVMAPAKVAITLPDGSKPIPSRERADSSANAVGMRKTGNSKERVSPGGTMSTRNGPGSSGGSATRTGGKVQMTDLEAGGGANDTDETSPTIVVKPYEESAWVDDIEVVELRHAVDDKFRAIWSEGIAAYINGDWQKARDVFQETMKLSNNTDGPSKYLIGVIDSNQGKAPDNWPGYKDES